MKNEAQELKEQEQQISHERKHNVVIAGVMILVGLVLVGANVMGLTFNNWWALFMLIPAFFLLGSVWQSYREHGRLTSQCTGSLIAGLATLTMVAIFLFNLSWSTLWPLAFVFGGIAVLLSGRK